MLGYAPGTSPSTLMSPKVSIMYGVVAYKYPLLKVEEGQTSVRHIITDWANRLDLSIGKAWKPELTIGPLSPESTDPPEIGRLASLAVLVTGTSMIQEFLEVMSAEVFRGEVPVDDIRMIYIRDAALLSSVD